MYPQQVAYVAQPAAYMGQPMTLGGGGMTGGGQGQPPQFYQYPPQGQFVPIAQGGGQYAAPQGGGTYAQAPYQPNYAQAAPQDASGQPYVVQAIPVAGGGVPLTQRPLRGMWSDTFCDCFTDCATCLMGWLFFPYLYARNKSRANLGEFWQTFLLFLIPWVLYIGTYTVGPLFMGDTAMQIVIIVGGVLLGVLGGQLRSQIREKFEIPGHIIEDTCLHLCCYCCAVTQEARHIDRSLGYLV